MAIVAPTRARILEVRALIEDGVVVQGKHSYGMPQLLRFAHDSTVLRIGSYSSIGPGCVAIMGGNHPIDRVTTFPLRERLGLPGAGTDGFPSSKGDISIGSDVWIGANSTLLSGISIGHGAVVAAGSVVVKDVPAYTVVGGNPSRVLKPRMSPEFAARLIQLAWWDWPDSVLIKVPELLSATVSDSILDQLEAIIPERGV
jgi:acetyltransferase-like isoleucine patch superfamily enzyme